MCSRLARVRAVEKKQSFHGFPPQYWGAWGQGEAQAKYNKQKGFPQLSQAAHSTVWQWVAMVLVLQIITLSTCPKNSGAAWFSFHYFICKVKKAPISLSDTGRKETPACDIMNHKRKLDSLTAQTALKKWHWNLSPSFASVVPHRGLATFKVITMWLWIFDTFQNKTLSV